MADQVPQPVFTLRGHQVGVTALTSLENTLISGDQEGNLCFWSLSKFRRTASWPNAARSKIQTLSIIKLPLNSSPKRLLVCQSRDNGVKLFDCDIISTNSPIGPIVLEFPTYEALFSRGDALTIDENTAILAYPSSIENFMVTIRYLGPDAQVLSAGNAARGEYKENDRQLRSTVFDIKLLANPNDGESYHVFAGYEDGPIVIFSTSLKSTKTVPELNVTGLKIDVIKIIDLGLTDFVAAFDVGLISDKYSLVCGSPKKELVFCSLTVDLGKEAIEKVALRKQGTSSLAIRPDRMLVAVAGWDNSLRLYSMKTRILLATMHHHHAQIHSIHFITKSSETESKQGSHLMCCASLDGTISVHDIY